MNRLSLFLVFFVILCMQLSVTVFAIEWREVFPKTYIDVGSINQIQDFETVMYPNRYHFWEKRLNDKSDVFTILESKSGKKIWYSLAHYFVDCHRSMFAVPEIVSYDLENKSILDANISEYPARWFGIPPGTVVDYYYKSICKPY